MVYTVLLLENTLGTIWNVWCLNSPNLRNLIIVFFFFFFDKLIIVLMHWKEQNLQVMDSLFDKVFVKQYGGEGSYYLYTYICTMQWTSYVLSPSNLM